MTYYKNKFDTHKEAFEENLEAIRILLVYEKSRHPDKWGSNQGCLGYSALILICSQINSFGHLFSGQKVGDKKIDSDKSTFHILNTDYFNSQNISTYALDEFYGCYRNKLTHNLALPTNFIMKLKSENELWYELTKDKSGQEIISTVYLMDLYNLCVSAYEKLRNEHKLKFETSKKIGEINFICLDTNRTNYSPSASGNTTF